MTPLLLSCACIADHDARTDSSGYCPSTFAARTITGCRPARMLTTRTRRLSWAAVPTTLAELTTLRLGGPAGRFETAITAAELIDAVQQADAAGESVLLLGGGSNLV